MPLDAPQHQPADLDGQRSERNRLLRSLPRSEYASLRPTLVRVALAPRQTLYEPRVPIAHVYFPETATLALVAELRRGGRIEVGGIGNEGFAGIPTLLGARSMPYRALVEIPGESFRLSAEAFRRALADHPVLRSRLLRYPLFLVEQIAQMVACNRLHTLTQRCARWLLVAHDRVQSDTFPLTQGFLAELLAVRRPGVSVAAEMLQDARCIRYSRGRITIMDRAGLQGLCCECYDTMRDDYAALFPDDEEVSASVLGRR
ncbi:MAG TPA: Crp/Fnr family transcriptional regulator [Gemmatimonadaceae bacterium]|nr:Crp/Fnr family transcriptional regulator [Gemmatimonadaceae bacterium]